MGVRPVQGTPTWGQRPDTSGPWDVPRPWPPKRGPRPSSVRLEVRAAHRPRAGPAGVVDLGGDCDLLLAGGEVGPLGVGTAAVRQPGAVVELQAAVEAVAGVDVPVAARLALGDGVPVQAVAAARGHGGRRALLGADLLDLGPRRADDRPVEDLAGGELAVDVDEFVRDASGALAAGGDHLGVPLVHLVVVVPGHLIVELDAPG